MSEAYPYRGSRNQRHVRVWGALVLEGMEPGERSEVVRVEYGEEFETLNGDAGIVAEGVELSTWTDPRIAPVEGAEVELIAQDGTGFWARITRDEDGEYGAPADVTWGWEVRGELANG